MSIGNRVFLRRVLPDPALVEGFRNIPAANTADCMNRFCAMHPRIKRLSPASAVVAGPALTVRGRAGDNLLIHQALDMALPGDVLVISNEGAQHRALMGEIMFSYAKYKQIAGLIVDGPVRDVNCLARLGLSVYATGSTPAGPYKNGPGEVNTPVSCGDICVNPGDIVIADADGVIIIPLADAAALLQTATAFSAADASKAQAAANGTASRDWVAKAVKETGVAIIDECFRG